MFKLEQNSELADVIGRNVKKLRKKKKVLQEDLGGCCGYSTKYSQRAFCYKLENGSQYEYANSLNLDKAFNICKILDISLEELIEGYDPGIPLSKQQGISREDAKEKLDLTEEDLEMIQSMETLTDEGIEMVKRYIEDLSGNPRYQK